MRTIKRWFSGGIAAALLCSHAYAAIDAQVIEARALLERGEAQHALDLLSPLEDARAGDPDFDTLLGIAANETAQFTRAVFALERALSVQPDNTRARAELGRALYAVGDYRASRKVLLETRQENIPPGAADTIDRYVQAIDRNEEAARSSIHAYIETGFGYDTNINSGPGNANVAVPSAIPLIGGLVFTLAPGSVKTSASFLSLGGGISGRYVLDPRWSLIGNASGTTRVNAKTSQFDSTQIDLNAGASYRYDQHEFSGAYQAGTYRVDGSGLRDQQGVIGEWTYRPDGFRQWNTYLQWGKLSYPGQSLRDADRTVVGTSYAHAFRSGLLVFGGAYVGIEKEHATGFPQFGHKLLGLKAGAQHSLREDFAIFGSLGYEARNYGGQDPFFLVTRHDRQTSLNLGFNWTPAKYWRVTPQLVLSAIRSNVAISDFNKTVFGVTLRRDF